MAMPLKPKIKRLLTAESALQIRSAVGKVQLRANREVGYYTSNS